MWLRLAGWASRAAPQVQTIAEHHQPAVRRSTLSKPAGDAFGVPASLDDLQLHFEPLVVGAKPGHHIPEPRAVIPMDQVRNLVCKHVFVSVLRNAFCA